MIADGDIVFYTYDNFIELNGTTFEVGELSAQFLNISSEEYTPIHDAFEQARKLKWEYENNQTAGTLRALNEEMWVVYTSLRKLPVFPYILEEYQERMFLDVRSLTEHYALSPELPPAWMEVVNVRTEEQARRRGEAILSGAIELDALTPEQAKDELDKTELAKFATLSWERYILIMDRYDGYLHDIRAFIPTIRHFIKFVLAEQETNSPESYAEALHFFYNDQRMAEKLIVNPIRFDGDCYKTHDRHLLSYVPRLLPDGRAVISQEHITDSLQGLMKADYMHALNNGNQIRRCIICHRYFLVRGGAHTLYCEESCPLKPRFTCRQFGSHDVQKELAKDNPKIQVKIKAFSRISKDLQREAITREEARRAKDYVRDHLYEALREPNVPVAKFEEDVKSEHVYEACGIVRKSNPRGRPKSAEGEA